MGEKTLESIHPNSSASICLRDETFLSHTKKSERVETGGREGQFRKGKGDESAFLAPEEEFAEPKLRELGNELHHSRNRCSMHNR